MGKLETHAPDRRLGGATQGGRQKDKSQGASNGRTVQPDSQPVKEDFRIADVEEKESFQAKNPSKEKGGLRSITLRTRRCQKLVERVPPP